MIITRDKSGTSEGEQGKQGVIHPEGIIHPATQTQLSQWKYPAFSLRKGLVITKHTPLIKRLCQCLYWWLERTCLVPHLCQTSVKTNHPMKELVSWKRQVNLIKRLHRLE